MKKTGIALLLGALLFGMTGCALIPEEAEYEMMPTVAELDNSEFETSVCERRDMVSELTLLFVYHSVHTEDLKFSVNNESYGEFYVNVGDEVKAGDLLASLDTADQEKTSLSMQEEIDSCERLLRQNEENRQLDLREAALSDEDTADKNRRYTQINESYDEKAKEYQDRIDIASMRKADADAEIEARRIYAPYDGLIMFVYTPEELELSSDTHKVITISDDSLPCFKAETDETEYFRYGDTLTIAVAGKDYNTIVTDPEELGYENDGESVYLVLDPMDYSIEDKARGSVHLILETREQVLAVPTSTISVINGKTVAYVPDENGLRTYKEVKTGIESGAYTEILEGLEEGDTVFRN